MTNITLSSFQYTELRYIAWIRAYITWKIRGKEMEGQTHLSSFPNQIILSLLPQKLMPVTVTFPTALAHLKGPFYSPTLMFVYIYFQK